MSTENIDPVSVDDPNKNRSSVRFSNILDNPNELEVDLPTAYQISNTRESKSLSQRARSTIKRAKEATKEIVHPDFIHEFNKFDNELEVDVPTTQNTDPASVDDLNKSRS